MRVKYFMVFFLIGLFIAGYMMKRQNTSIVISSDVELSEEVTAKKVVKKAHSEDKALTHLSEGIEVNSDAVEKIISEMKNAHLKADKEEIAKKEKEYQRVTAELKKDVLEFQNLAWQEINSIDPYRDDEDVKKWSERNNGGKK